MEKRACIGWNGRPARGCRRLAGSISRSEPARRIAPTLPLRGEAPDAGRVGQRAGRPFHSERAASAVARARIWITIPDSQVQDWLQPPAEHGRVLPPSEAGWKCGLHVHDVL